MKYLIAYLAQEELASFQQSLLYEISTKFNAQRAILRKPPAHITLKYWFETEDIQTIEDLISKFCEKHKKAPFIARDFGSFRKDVIFINIVPSEGFKLLHKELLNKLGDKLAISEIDKEGKFHMSVAFHDIEDEFDEIWKFVSAKEIHFQENLDNISILKVEDNLLKIHKTFHLQ